MTYHDAIAKISAERARHERALARIVAACADADMGGDDLRNIVSACARECGPGAGLAQPSPAWMAARSITIAGSKGRPLTRRLHMAGCFRGAGA